MTRTRRTSPVRAFGVTLAGVLALTGCGDGDTDAAPGGVDTETVVATETALSTETETATDTATDTVTATDTATVTATDTETAVETQTETIDADEPEPGGIDANTEPDTAEPTGATPVLVDVRVGSHAGYDRVVWEFAGGGTPGWRAEYVDDPTRQGSGFAVELPGEATLAVTIEGVGAPFDAPAGVDAYDSSGRIAAASTEVITEVVPGGWYEGYLDGFVGVTSEQPFRVRLFEDPTRVVLDVEQ